MMLSYHEFILVLSYLPVDDISRVTRTCRINYECRENIIRSVYIERYPELVQSPTTSYIGLEPTLFNLIYIDRVWQLIHGYSLESILESVSLLGISSNHGPEYDMRISEIDRFSHLVSRVQSTYDKLFDMLSLHIQAPIEDPMDDNEYDPGSYDPEDHDMFVHALIMRGHSLYQQLMASEDPLSLLDDDTIQDRSNGLYIEDMNYPGDEGYLVHDITEDLVIDDMEDDEEYRDKTSKDIISTMEDDGYDYDDITASLEEEIGGCDIYEQKHDRLYLDLTETIEDMDPSTLISRLLSSSMDEEHRDAIVREILSTVIELSGTLNNRCLYRFIESIRK